MPRLGLLAVALAITSAANAVAQDVNAETWSDESQDIPVAGTTFTISGSSSCDALSQGPGIDIEHPAGVGLIQQRTAIQ